MAKKNPKSEKSRTGGRERLYIRVSPMHKKMAQARCAAENMTMNELVVDAIGKYIGIDTSEEDSIVGSLLTQRRVTDEIQAQINMLTELFLTYIDYFFSYSKPLETEEEKEKASERGLDMFPKYLRMCRYSMEEGGRIPDVLKHVPEFRTDWFDDFMDQTNGMDG